MKATLILKDRGQISATLFYETTVWRVPNPVEPASHLFKYSLVLIENGVRVIGFDNERGKGDHLHKDGVESQYQFVSIEKLVDDFFAEVETWKER
ncbi:hypothetical protein AGMMS49545_12070 [Betaproteobacteria bacterium]|nr:hypothetical protein AGMMS49545_12070 [Betaproteobacteria bacterium]GHU42628.1 hypothetical protein AGMMS50289_07650 [Betaproteobacteria bacterium]